MLHDRRCDDESEEALSWDKFTSDLHIEMAAKGCVSGTLAEWPALKQSLFVKNGIVISEDTDAITLRKICVLICAACRLEGLEE